jgi:acyl transferase domain-containing protein
MARPRHDEAPAFRAALDRLLGVLPPAAEPAVRTALLDEDAPLPPLAAVVQPALTIQQLALAAYWQALGVTPMAVTGHSLGEYAAAAVAGVIDPADAVRVARWRGELMDDHGEAGGMLAVAAGAEAVAAAIAASGLPLDLAVINAPDEVVVAGPVAALDSFARRLDGRRATRLTVTHGFHSHGLDPMLAPFRAALAAMPWATPRLPFVSARLAAVAAPADWPAYWAAQTREPVRFAEALRALDGLGPDIVLEIGPAAVLTRLARRSDLRAAPLASLDPDGGERQALLTAVAQIHVRGGRIDFAMLQAGRERRVAPLPGYPFERQPYWFEAPERPGRRAWLGEALAIAGGSTVYETRLPRGWLLRATGLSGDDARRAGMVALVEILAEALVATDPAGEVTGIELLAPVPTPGPPVRLQTVVEPSGVVVVYAATPDGFTPLARARLVAAEARRPAIQCAPSADARFAADPAALAAILPAGARPGRLCWRDGVGIDLAESAEAAAE